jgi:hypothetical protein
MKHVPAILMLVLAAGGPCLAQTHRYSATPINPTPATDIVPIALNSRGEAVGVATGLARTPYLYRPGQGTTQLPAPPGYPYVVPTDINDQGVIVGYCMTGFTSEEPRGWRLENGLQTLLPIRTYPHAINNSGVIAGRTCWTQGFPTAFTCYFRDLPGGPMPDETFGSASSYPVSEWRFAEINSAGDVAFTGAPGAPAHVRAADGTLTQITPAPAPYVRTFTWGINDQGQVIGRWEYNIGSQYFSRAFLWTRQAGAREVGIPAVHVRPRGLNNLGHVVGESGGNENSYLDVWLWTPERGNEDLEPLVDPAANLNLISVAAINDAGQILVRAIRLEGGASVTAILTPLAAPCNPDYNADGNVDQDDVSYLINVIGGGENPTGIDPDFNGDGNADQDDNSSLINVVAGGNCP